MQLYTGDIFKVLQVFCNHHHTMHNGCATYEQIKIIVSRSAGQTQARFLCGKEV